MTPAPTGSLRRPTLRLRLEAPWARTGECWRRRPRPPAIRARSKCRGREPGPQQRYPVRPPNRLIEGGELIRRVIVGQQRATLRVDAADEVAVAGLEPASIEGPRSLVSVQGPPPLVVVL